jgi:hypothetical protein
MKQFLSVYNNKKLIGSLVILFFICSIFLSCASSPAILSKTREIFVSELDGAVLISAIQDAGKSTALTGTQHIRVTDDKKRLAILSIQIQSTIKEKVYELSPIVLLDGDIKILPDAVKYFSGNSALGVNWGINSRNIITNTLTMSGKGGKYTANLIYVVDVDSEITRAEIFGQVIEFDPEQVKLDVLDKFH